VRVAAELLGALLNRTPERHWTSIVDFGQLEGVSSGASFRRLEDMARAGVRSGFPAGPVSLPSVHKSIHNCGFRSERAANLRRQSAGLAHDLIDTLPGQVRDLRDHCHARALCVRIPDRDMEFPPCPHETRLQALPRHVARACRDRLANAALPLPRPGGRRNPT
jgi:hypothetical protein